MLDLNPFILKEFDIILIDIFSVIHPPMITLYCVLTMVINCLDAALESLFLFRRDIQEWEELSSRNDM